MADEQTISSTEPQWVEGEGLMLDGKPVEEDEPKPIAELIDEASLDPGDAIPILPSGTKIAASAEGSEASPAAPEADKAEAKKSSSAKSESAAKDG